MGTGDFWLRASARPLRNRAVWPRFEGTLEAAPRLGATESYKLGPKTLGARLDSNQFEPVAMTNDRL